MKKFEVTGPRMTMLNFFAQREKVQVTSLTTAMDRTLGQVHWKIEVPDGMCDEVVSELKKLGILAASLYDLPPPTLASVESLDDAFYSWFKDHYADDKLILGEDQEDMRLAFRAGVLHGIHKMRNG